MEEEEESHPLSIRTAAVAAAEQAAFLGLTKSAEWVREKEREGGRGSVFAYSPSLRCHEMHQHGFQL